MNKNMKKINHRSGSRPQQLWKNEYEVQHGEPPSRGDVFIAMHKGKDGKYKSDEAKAVGERIEEIQALGLARKNVASNDAFALALNKPKHPGRVRGLGYEVFGESACIRKRSRYYSSAEVATLKTSSDKHKRSNHRWRHKYSF
ncbi:hypothetical protein LINPERPRIM_LOCUS42774 [Linum perenne]